MSDDDSATVAVLTLGHSGFEVRGTYGDGGILHVANSGWIQHRH